MDAGRIVDGEAQLERRKGRGRAADGDERARRKTSGRTQAGPERGRHVAVQGAPLPGEPLAFALTGAGEVLTGMILGFVLTLLFAAIQVAGQMLDMQSGFGMINVFNPALETQFPVFGFFLFIVAVLFLFATNGHHVMIRGLVSTFDRIPVGGFVARPRLLWEISHWGRGMFSDGLLIALSTHIDRAAADKLAAIITGMRALAHGAAGELSKGQVMQVLVEMASGYLFVSAISGGSTIGVVAARDSDLGLVGFEIALLVERVGAQLTPALITELKNSLVAV